MRVLRLHAGALVLLAGCSFVGVRSPSKTIDPSTVRPDQIHCNESDLLPSLDALGGAGAIFATGAGIILQHTTDKDRYDHFTLYYAGPTLALAILYFTSASYGNTRVSRCTELKETAARVPPPAPVLDDEKPKTPGIEIE